ncbi:MAG: capsule assembly Wzi family protein, partial [Acidobacteriaceae bacterium]
YHLSANEWVQFEYMRKRTPGDFIPGGVSQNQYKIDVVKRLTKNLELNAWMQVERWKAPIYIQKVDDAENFDNVIAFKLTWYPHLHTDATVKPTGQP